MAHLYDAVQEESEWEAEAEVEAEARVGSSNGVHVADSSEDTDATEVHPTRLPPAARYESAPHGRLDAYSEAVMTRWMQFAGCTTPFDATAVAGKDASDRARSMAVAPAPLLVVCDAEPVRTCCSALHCSQQCEAGVHLLPGACVLRWPAAAPGEQDTHARGRTVSVLPLHHTCGAMQRLRFEMESEHLAGDAGDEARHTWQRASASECGSDRQDGGDVTSAAAAAVIRCADSGDRILVVAEWTSAHRLRLWRARGWVGGAQHRACASTRDDAAELSPHVRWPVASHPHTVTGDAHVQWLPSVGCFLSVHAHSACTGSVVTLWRVHVHVTAHAAHGAPCELSSVSAQAVHACSIAWHPCSVVADPVLPLVWSVTPSGVLWVGSVVRGDAATPPSCVHWARAAAHLVSESPHEPTASAWVLDVTPAPHCTLLAVNRTTGAWRVLSTGGDGGTAAAAAAVVDVRAAGSLSRIAALPVQQVRAHGWGWYALDAQGAVHALRWPGDALYVVRSAWSLVHTSLPAATDSAFVLCDTNGQRGVVHDFSMLHACCCCTQGVAPRATADGTLDGALVAQPFAAHVPYFVHARVRAHAERVAAAAAAATGA
ncbi:MAG: hypothetical protein EOO65_00900 [Methanosarcinales archaeon]|nr:MAG: hypothetical protein EOO65_00900 [Methanosarcinales archaeon]